MTQDWQQLVPEALHDPVRAALAATAGATAVECLGAISSGGSGAVALRMRSDGHDWLLRVEAKRHALRNPHQYLCMERAAAAGIAPPLHYVDAEHGVALMDLIPTVPLAAYPGGPAALAPALGELVRDLQACEPFPPLFEQKGLTGHMLAALEARAAPGLLDRHREAFQNLVASIDWDAVSPVASHNDPNPQNVLFDGQRLWLIDWESASRNDPYVDPAILGDTLLAGQEDLKQALLGAWLGRAPSAEESRRLDRIAVLTRLYYAGLLFVVSGPAEAPLADLAAPSPAELQALLAGATAPTPEILRMLGLMRLRDFLDGWNALAR